jgi:GNAT superfamily N-acetyltransferase
MNKIAFRRAAPRDAVAIEALFRLIYRNGSHPFQTVDDVARFLADTRNVQVVVEDRGQLIASMAMTYHGWNHSYELGRAITHPDFRSQGLAAALIQPVVDLVANRRMGDVYFGFPRVRRILDLCATLAPPMILTGHDAGRHVANGARETHAVVYAIPPSADFWHVVPEAAAIGGEVFESRVRTPLGVSRSRGKYPCDFFVGDIGLGTTAFGGLLIRDDRASSNRSVEVVGDRLVRQCVREASRQVERLLVSGGEHLTLTVLADKAELIAELVRCGLRATAYLPAWYKSGRFRYDCFQMTWHACLERPRADGLDDALSVIESELAAVGLATHSGAA